MALIGLAGVLAGQLERRRLKRRLEVLDGAAQGGLIDLTGASHGNRG